MGRVDFERELSVLLSAPYAYVYIVTWDESRAVAAVTEAAELAGRPVRQWSYAQGLEGEEGSPGPEDLRGLMQAIEVETSPTIFVLKDIHPYVGDPWVVRRLREMEPLAAAFGKTIVFVGPVECPVPELIKDVTVIHMPLPGRDALTQISHVVFPVRRWPQLDRDGLVSGGLGLTSRQALRAFHRVKLEWLRAAEEGLEDFDPEASMLAEKRRLVENVEVIEFVEPDRGVSDVGGMEELKDWLVERQDAFGERARAFGLPVPKGLLLLGVQGCGKSLMAKAVARHWNLPLLRLDIGALFGGNREPDAALRTAIRTAEAVAPSVLWVDEIEKVFDLDAEGRSSAMRLLAGLLTWLQEKTEPVFFVATANEVTHLPPELLRKGRFDEVFFVDLPDRRAREHILTIHLRLQRRDPASFDVERLSILTRNFSGAELEQVVVAALYMAFSAGVDVGQEHLERACEATIPLYRTYEDRIKALRDWAQQRARFAARDSTILDFFEATRPTPRR